MLSLKLAVSIKTSKLLAIFSGIGFLWSIFVTLPQISVFNFGFEVFGLSIVLFLSLPIVLTIVSIISIYSKKKGNYSAYLSQKLLDRVFDGVFFFLKNHRNRYQ